jgi:hypothetical protein
MERRAASESDLAWLGDDGDAAAAAHLNIADAVVAAAMREAAATARGNGRGGGGVSEAAAGAGGGGVLEGRGVEGSVGSSTGGRRRGGGGGREGGGGAKGSSWILGAHHGLTPVGIITLEDVIEELMQVRTVKEGYLYV